MENENQIYINFEWGKWGLFEIVLMHVPVYMRCREVCGAVWGGNELRVREIERAREGLRVRISHVHKSGDRINTAPVVTVQMMQFPLQIRYHRKKDVTVNSRTRFNL
jgi:hypothetical protein